MKVGNGSNVTVPSGLTVYVPSPGTVNVVNVHEEVKLKINVVGHSFTLVGTSVAPDPAVSFVKIGMI